MKVRNSYRLVPYEKVRRVWSYVAQVNRVIDGDTMWVTLDTGFGDYVDQKLRLRGIDTAEMGPAEGQRAKDFVNQAVGNENLIVVATTKVDKYDRYLADVLYSPEATTDVSEILANGIYLNRQLITEEVAERYV